MPSGTHPAAHGGTIMKHLSPESDDAVFKLWLSHCRFETRNWCKMFIWEVTLDGGSETGKRREPRQGTLMSSLLLWALGLKSAGYLWEPGKTTLACGKLGSLSINSSPWLVEGCAWGCSSLALLPALMWAWPGAWAENGSIRASVVLWLKAAGVARAERMRHLSCSLQDVLVPLPPLSILFTSPLLCDSLPKNNLICWPMALC